MSIYCPDFNVLYIQTPCTGSTALGRFLVDNFGGIDFGGQHMTVVDAVNFWPKMSTTYKFCTIRNPYDKIATQYYKHNFHSAIKYPDNLYRWCFKNNPSFEEYVHAALIKFERDKDWPMYFPRCENNFGDWAWTNGVDAVLPQELIQEGIYYIIGVNSKLIVPCQNKTKGKPNYKTLHTPLTRSIIFDRYRLFMEKHGYSFHGNIRQIKL